MGDIKEGAKATGWFFYVIIVVAIGGVLFTGIHYLVMPYFIHQETKIVRASNSYITAQQEALRSFKADYDKIELYKLNTAANKANHKTTVEDDNLLAGYSNQQEGIILQMKQLAQLIPDNVPPDIQTLISTH